MRQLSKTAQIGDIVIFISKSIIRKLFITQQNRRKSANIQEGISR
jgi:hypothetical protein